MPFISPPNIPWEDKPAGCDDQVWCCSANPIIARDLIPSLNGISTAPEQIARFRPTWRACLIVSWFLGAVHKP